MALPPSRTSTRYLSLAGRLVAFTVAVFCVAILAGLGVARLVEPWWLGFVIALLVGIPLLAFGIDMWLRPAVGVIEALASGADSLRDADFSVTIAASGNDELAELVAAHNRLGQALRQERQTLYQRELLLDTVIQTTDIALVLCNAYGHVVYSNASARQLLHAGKPVNGEELVALVGNLPQAFGDALRRGDPGLFTVEADEPQTYHLSVNEFMLNAQPHKLYLVKHLTQELNRQEVATWKKVIRLISHELNNSLAPISSLAHSGRTLVDKTAADQRLDGIFGTIAERASHLQRFIEGYAQFARLPAPRKQAVRWQEFLESLRGVIAFELDGTVPTEPVYLDTTQFEQVMINLLKNAHESGSDPDRVVVAVRHRGDGAIVTVRDAGGGIGDDVMRRALLPFYSTKKTGTGLGLPLCREIVESHGGRLSLANVDGGLEVRISLPGASAALPDVTSATA